MSDAHFVKSDRGQTIIVFALLFSTLVLFTGLALDAGLLYATKAKLSSSVDGACLAGMKNLALGQPTAAALATNIFNANYGANPPVPTITFPIDQNNNQQVKVTATANVNTYFIRLISAFATVPVSDTAVSTRGKLIMSIVLDRSGSMASDGGQQALQAAVPQFVANFNNILDEVGLVSFSDNAEVNEPIGFNFITPISNYVSNTMQFRGGTFGTGAGTGSLLSSTEGAPLSMAGAQVDSVPIQPGQNAVKVIVYFTDGLMNTVQDNFNCPNKVLLNYGGIDNPQSGTYGYIFDPSSETAQFGLASGTQIPYNASGAICVTSTGRGGTNVTTFTSQIDGSQKSFLQTNITTEAKYRATQTANALRSETPTPTFIYSMGMGAGVSSATQTFLAQLANDPTGVYGNTYIPTQTAGNFFYIASCPCTSELNTAFHDIAAKILLRLTQ
jgi:Flp pilus assembly protein TadG